MSESNWLADQFLRSVEGLAWHGPDLMETLKGVTAAQAAVSPSNDRHGIWQLLLHLGVWTDTAQRRIGGEVVEVDAAADWPLTGEVTEERWQAAQAEFRLKAVAFAALIRTLTPEDLKRMAPGCEYNMRFLVNGVIQHTAYHTGQIALLKAVDGKKEMLRHTLATLVYRGGKAIRDAPASFANFQAGPDSRTPLSILAHIGDLLDWALSLAKGTQAWKNLNSGSWDTESARFFAAAEALDAQLKAGGTGYAVEKIFQGPIADALHHTGQIAYLRRLAEAPIKGENYARAKIEAGRVGSDQAAAVHEF